MKRFLPVRYTFLYKLLSPKNWIVIFQKSNIAIKSEQCFRHHLLLSISFIHMWICLHWHYCCAFVTILIFLSKKYWTPSKWLWTCIEGKRYHCSIFACNTSTPTYNSYNYPKATPFLLKLFRSILFLIYLEARSEKPQLWTIINANDFVIQRWNA